MRFSFLSSLQRLKLLRHSAIASSCDVHKNSMHVIGIFVGTHKKPRKVQSGRIHLTFQVKAENTQRSSFLECVCAPVKSLSIHLSFVWFTVGTRWYGNRNELLKALQILIDLQKNEERFNERYESGELRCVDRSYSPGMTLHRNIISKQEFPPSEITTEWQYVCTTCGKTFMSASHLKQHAVVHMCEFAFNVCCKSFSCKDNLRSHALKHLLQQKINKKVAVNVNSMLLLSDKDSKLLYLFHWLHQPVQLWH